MTRTIPAIITAEWLRDHLRQTEVAAGSGAEVGSAPEAAATAPGAAPTELGAVPADSVSRSVPGRLTIIDTRFAEEYAAGHIPGAISVPFGIQSAWAESGGDYLLELPADEGLFQLIGDCGLTAESTVVVVGRVEEPPAPRYALADPVRVAATLMYAGVRDVAVLSGGHPS